MENDFEETEMEKQFLRDFEAMRPKFGELRQKVRDAVNEMVKLSRETGIPFDIYAFGAGNGFIPKEFRDKYPGLSRSFVREYVRMGEYSDVDTVGWTTSYC